jgi:hypothetical protein
MAQHVRMTPDEMHLLSRVSQCFRRVDGQASGQVTGEEAPATRLLAIRGYAFDFGTPISEAARENLAKAIEHLLSDGGLFA